MAGGVSAELAAAEAPQPEAQCDAERRPAEHGDVHHWSDERLGDRAGVHDHHLQVDTDELNDGPRERFRSVESLLPEAGQEDDTNEGAEHCPDLSGQRLPAPVATDVVQCPVAVVGAAEGVMARGRRI